MITATASWVGVLWFRIDFTSFFSILFLSSLSQSSPPFFPFPSFLSFLVYGACLRACRRVCTCGGQSRTPATCLYHFSTWSLTVLVILTRLAARLVLGSTGPDPWCWFLHECWEFELKPLWLQSRDSYPQRHFPSLGKHFLSWFGSCSYGWMQRVKANGLNA